jgi:hypothetical protein
MTDQTQHTPAEAVQYWYDAAAERREERDRLRAVVARIRQMADYWEQQLPEVIRTPAVVSALRAAMEPAVSSVGQAPTTKQPTLPAAAQPPLLAAAFALEMDRKESVGEGTNYRRGMARAIKLLRLLNEEAPTAPAGQAPAPDRVKAVAEALEFGSVCCPLCRGTVVLHTPNGARAHFTAVHPDQRITGRGPGPWPLLVASEDEALPALTDPTAVDVVRALHQPDDLGECRECRASSPCPTLRTLDGSATAVVSGRTADETGDDLPAVSSAGQAPAPDRTAVLSDAERQMLNYALNQAQVRMWSVGGFTDEDQAAVVSLRRLADEPAAVVSGRTADETPCRGDQFEAWLTMQRDAHRDDDRGQWTTLDNLLNLYRLHADAHAVGGAQQPTEARP